MKTLKALMAVTLLITGSGLAACGKGIDKNAGNQTYESCTVKTLCDSKVESCAYFYTDEKDADCEICIAHQIEDCE